MSSVSSSSSSPTPSTPPPAGGGGGGSIGGNGNQNNFPPGVGPQITSSASLYLYTFLATIVLLLVVSATIVTRSYTLRRRQQAALAEAIANGTYVPPKKPDVGKRPKMFEVHVGDVKKDSRMSMEKEKAKERVGSGILVEWDKMMPVSCRWASPPGTPQAPLPLTPPSPQLQSRFWRWRRLSRGPHALLLSTFTHPTTTPNDPRTSTSTPHRSSRSTELTRLSVSSTEKRPPTPEPPEDKVRVAVFIRMPLFDPEAGKRKSPTEPGEIELPYVEFGVAEVPVAELAKALDGPARTFSEGDVGSGSTL